MSDLSAFGFARNNSLGSLKQKQTMRSVPGCVGRMSRYSLLQSDRKH